MGADQATHGRGRKLRRAIVEVPLSAVLQPDRQEQEHAGRAAGRNQISHCWTCRVETVEGRIAADAGRVARNCFIEDLLPSREAGVNGRNRLKSDLAAGGFVEPGIPVRWITPEESGKGGGPAS